MPFHDPAFGLLDTIPAVTDRQTDTLLLQRLRCGQRRAGKNTIVIPCQSVTKRRQRRRQVACGVDRHTAAELQVPSPIDPPSRNKQLTHHLAEILSHLENTEHSTAIMIAILLSTLPAVFV